MNHNNFILSPVSEILKDMVSASSGIGNGIESFPLFEYIMQSTFLKITGAQEQKMKCIVWELATHDYEYRYMRFTKNQLGECSNYSEKQKIYKDIIEQIKKHGRKDFDINSIGKNKILKQTTQFVEQTFVNTNIAISSKRSFDEYIFIWKDIKDNYSATKDNLFVHTAAINDKPEDTLLKMYEYLYSHRNRIAHNTLSYQQNLSSLNVLIKEEYKLNNYFIYFSLLILIDNVMINLYKQYLNTIENN